MRDMAERIPVLYIMEEMKKMKESVNVKIIYHFYHHVVKAELKRRDFPKDVVRKIGEEHHKIIQWAKDIGNSRLLS